MRCSVEEIAVYSARFQASPGKGNFGEKRTSRNACHWQAGGPARMVVMGGGLLVLLFWGGGGGVAVSEL